MHRCRVCDCIIHQIGAHYCPTCQRHARICTWELVILILVMIAIALMSRYWQ